MDFKSEQTHKHTELGEYAGWIKGDTVNLTQEAAVRELV